MKIYQCDFCKTTKPCTQTFIDSKRYDICAACRDKRDEELKNCGEQAIQYYPNYVANYIYYTPTITVPYYQPAPTWQPTPVITWSGSTNNTCTGNTILATTTGSSSCQV